jgi:hypothetical protein
MNKDEIKYVFSAIVAAILLFMAYIGYNQTKQTPQADTNQLYIERLQAKNDLLLNLVNELDSIASQTKQTAIVYRTRTEYIRLHDTLNQRFTDSAYCQDLERENQNLWYLAELDSNQISTLKQVISNDSLSLIECSQVVAKVQQRANNEAKKANKRLAWIKSLGLVAIVEGLIIATK